MCEGEKWSLVGNCSGRNFGLIISESAFASLTIICLLAAGFFVQNQVTATCSAFCEMSFSLLEMSFRFLRIEEVLFGECILTT